MLRGQCGDRIPEAFDEIAEISRSSDQVLGAAYPMAGSEGGIMQRLIVGWLTATQIGGERLQKFRPEL